MERKITYRHNIMTINSIDTFLSIKGGFNNNIRDVYFVRAVGEPKGIIELIHNIDKKMGIEMANDHLKYIRFNSLPKIKDIKDSEFYLSVYEKWANGQGISLRNIDMHGNLKNVIGNACSKVIDKYVENKQTATKSMIRNFATKIFFWLDETCASILSNWNERACIKVIADNVVKEQEYLFYLFLTLLGCDVLLIQNRKDVEFSKNLIKYTCKFTLGEFGSSTLSQYTPYVPEENKNIVKKEKKATTTTNSNLKVVIPKKPEKNKNVSEQNRTNVAKVKTTQVLLDNNSKAEKSFEELAQLASSVVLIAVHDSSGDIIGTGSGIMIGRNGYILTNNHVVKGGVFYSVRIEDDEKVYPTDEVIKYNSVTDLAIIRIDRTLNPIPVYSEKKKLVRGQKVVAIGSPLGLFNSVSDGIISGFRNMDNVDMIQFTAPISQGSSGGAVLNMQGEVIGISTAGFDDGQNINLAVGYESIRMFANGFLNAK